VAITRLFAVSMTETEFAEASVTYTDVPLGVVASELGEDPTGTVAVTVLLAVLITETVFAPWFAT